jgi:hypothetical protein
MTVNKEGDVTLRLQCGEVIMPQLPLHVVVWQEGWSNVLVYYNENAASTVNESSVNDALHPSQK